MPQYILTRKVITNLMRNRTALRCRYCQEELREGDKVISAPNGTQAKHYHLGCYLKLWR